MITRRTFVAVAGLLGLAGLGASMLVGARLHAGSQRISSAAWKATHATLEEMVKGVDVIAVVEAGDTKPSRVAYSDGGEDSLPFEATAFKVVNGLKGTMAGEELVVERAGGSDDKGEPVYLDADGGAFEKGGTYVLFLKRQEDGPYFYQVNDQGRFRVEAGRLRAAVDPNDPVAAALHGRGLAEATGLVKAAEAGPRK